ncbi:MAG: hypothetical protein NWR78_02935 [Aquiluna sp.]|nr:hypothetical protein [Aquiluna sp.]
MNPNLQFQDRADLSDLTAFLTRAKKLDPEGAVKLKSFDQVLGVYVSPIFTGSLLGDGPTVLGLRTMKLSEASDLDATFALSSILERIANLGLAELSLSMPPSQVRTPWSGITPPRDGWLEVATLGQSQISTWAKDGIAEVAAALPEAVGASIASKVRLQIWGKTVDESLGLPGAAAFAMSGLGFMNPGETVRVFESGNWLRLSTNHGHVLSKKSARG